MNAIVHEVNFNFFCYKKALGNLSSAFNSINDVFTSSITDSQPPLTLKGRCSKLTQVSGLVIKAILLCIPLINKISQFASNKTVLSIIQKDGMALRHVPENLKADLEVVRAAIHQNPEALQFASRDIVLTVLTQYRKGYLLKYASEALKEDRAFMLAVVKRNSNVLKYASEALKEDRDFMLAALKQNGCALYYASESLRKDKEIVSVAIKQNGNALKYASEALKKDRTFILFAIEQDNDELEYASKDLRKDRDFILAVVKQNGLVLEYASEALKRDIEIV
ncbi:MAG: DUF4116 domain-containing protein, partial [Candidatus Rhabdochlamydia sp.]